MARSLRTTSGSAACPAPARWTRFGHLGWGYHNRADFLGRAAEFIAACLRDNQRVAYIADDGHAALRAELSGIPAVAESVASGAIDVIPAADFYVFASGGNVVHAELTLSKYVAAVEQAITDGYRGFAAVVDVTSVARTTEQRAAMAALEYLGDQQIALRPFSALCGYDIGQLGPAAGELICLHPSANKDATNFRLYAEPEAGMTFALAGEIDAAGHQLFATTLERIWPLSRGDTLRIDAQQLQFISHRQMSLLEECARAHNREVVLWTDQPVPTRLVDLLKLTSVRVEVTPPRPPQPRTCPHD